MGVTYSHTNTRTTDSTRVQKHEREYEQAHVHTDVCSDCLTPVHKYPRGYWCIQCASRVHTLTQTRKDDSIALKQG